MVLAWAGKLALGDSCIELFKVTLDQGWALL